MMFLGIDPGKSGAAALLTAEFQVVTMIKFTETERDISDWFHDLKRITDRSPPDVVAVIEKVHSMPKQGVKSSFSFGQSYGFLRGLLISHDIRFAAVTARAWQKALGCLSRGDKNVTKSRAQEWFPGVKVTHALADALLLAEFCRRREVAR